MARDYRVKVISKPVSVGFRINNQPHIRGDIKEPDTYKDEHQPAGHIPKWQRCKHCGWNIDTTKFSGGSGYGNTATQTISNISASNRFDADGTENASGAYIKNPAGELYQSNIRLEYKPENAGCPFCHSSNPFGTDSEERT